ncbi:interleukin-31 receptor subunit alpha [Triplophysa rosa]|uniref:Interleukin-6 receptor subunit beta-like n=1 Tax=Triplophysa rosa TaxID=992332 RepID=A0A9W7X1T6_TRIRA|nr:interleukin-31 receptor subunit alpha [Triplophysa rosa]KAI7812557.1 putative interleukin-6 receptor subunit beta-like [Triplophysa rosa]
MREHYAALYLTLGFVSLCTAVCEASTGSCDCNRIRSLVTNCNFTEGVDDFTCVIKKKYPFYICKWKPERDVSTSYKIYIKQRHCRCAVIHQKNRISASDDLRVINTTAMTAYVIAREEQWNCTYKRFSGILSQMTLCGPPSKVTYERSSGQMSVQVDWVDDSEYIKQFLIKYREFNSTGWKEQLSINNRECDIWNLTSSLSYEMQVQCIPNEECSQCPFGELITLPCELTEAPSIQHEIQDLVQNPLISAGQRKVILEWKHANSEAVTYYNVIVKKVTGECSNFATKDSSLTLFLSYSAYNISVRGLNSAGSSPAATITIENMDVWTDWFRPFNVSITSNNSFSLWWSSSISRVCFSVEWWASGQIPAFRPFYADTQKTQKDITKITESTFQPYTRYNFILHTRPYKDTCNMKNVNDSELTYGTSKAYLTEGSPISAPGNVSIRNITQHTSVVTWSPVSEEDLRGFLLGYIIYYTEDNTEASYKVDPSLNSYELQNLKINSAYRVQLAAFTAAGEGERSDPKPFVTNPLEFTALSSIIAAVIVGIIIFLLAFHLSCRFMQRAKKLIWPSIPNPGNSSAVQKIEIGHELDILEPLNRHKLEESEACDSSTVCVVESRKEASHISSSPTSEVYVKPTIFLSENECSTSTLEETTDSSTSAPNEESAETENSALSASVDNENKESEDLFKSQTDFSVTAPVKPAVVFMSDYTTMEFFQQVAMTGIQGPSMKTGKPGLVSVHPGHDYVRQSCFAGNEQPSVSSGASNGTDVLHIDLTVL